MKPQYSVLCRFLLLIYLLFLPLGLSGEIVCAFEYDKNNQLIKEQKANGCTITYEYDCCGRIVKEIASDGSSVEFAYDKNGNCIKMVDRHGTSLYVYDPLNRLQAVHFPDLHSILYGYDTRGRLTDIVYPNGSRIAYRYDSSSRLVSVTDQTGTTKYDYNDVTNTLTKITLPNGVFTEYQYDRVKRITDVAHRCVDGEIIASYHYSFDSSGNRTEIKSTGCSGTRKTICTYDKLNRLTSVEYPDGYEKYTYDGLGNRLSLETQDGMIQYEYDKSNRLIRAGDISFFYDLCGNLIKRVAPNETTEFSYDTHDNLVQVRNGVHSVKYGYDGARRRIFKDVDGIVTKYINDIRLSATQVILKMTAADQVSALYTYGLSRIAEVISAGVGFYLYDYPDRNVVALVDGDQQVRNQYEYDSFGARQKVLIGLTNDFSYAGEAYDEETKLIYLRNRYYDPKLGRFITPDPEFGSKTDPQSLNPYTYVSNNPLNYIDPMGLRSAKACAYPAGTKTKSGTSAVGHGFWELTYDNGEVKRIGRYPNPQNMYSDNIYPGTVSHEWPATDAQIDQIITSVKKGPYLGVSGNCIDGLERGLKILGVDHPSFSFCGVSVPTKAVMWLESLNGRSDFADKLERDMQFAADPDLYMAMMARKPQIPAVAQSTGDVGGVSLNKTAKLLGYIPSVQGATYDPATGQLIMIGKKKSISLPEMNFDDLAVAVRSIYGLGGKNRQDPGISLDFDPKHPIDFQKIIRDGKKPPPMLTRYEGQTKDTRFGQIMFEADRLLKNLSLGKDNKSGKSMKCDVSGYKTLPERYQKNKLFQKQDHMETRLWFVPKEMTLHKNHKGTAIAFKKAHMGVLTESTHKYKKKKNGEAEKFAEHFTENYSKFSKEYPILKELKRLGKITAVVKWMRENKIPLDLSLFEKYKPTYHHTPNTTPAIYISLKDEKENMVHSIVGGVIYHLDESNFHEIVNDDVNPLTMAALNSRPSENVFTWTFKSPQDSVEYQAVAQTVERTAKVGNVRRACVDMRFTVTGEYPLELVRYYNSFNDNDIGFGRGWDIVDTKLTFPRPRVQVQWKHDAAPVAVYSEIFAELDGRQSRLGLIGLGEDKNPLYRTDDGQAILAEKNYGFILYKGSGEKFVYSHDGKILSKGRNNHTYISYCYNGENCLSEVVHVKGKKIQLHYDNGHVVCLTGPGDKVVQYRYNMYGELDHVADSIGVIERYGYDSDKNMASIRNGHGDLIFEAAYDDYHRAVTQTVRGKRETKNFDLKARTLQVDTAQKNGYFSKYDASYRLLETIDFEDRHVQLTYEKDQARPTAISDCLGNEKKYSYDPRGNITRIVDSQGVEERFWYNEDNLLFAAVDGMGKAELYFYNEQGQLVRCHHLAQLVSENSDTSSANFSYSNKYVTEYEYDPETHLLLRIKQDGEPVQQFSYDCDGMIDTVRGSEGYALHRRYDARGRLVMLSDPQGEGFEYSYDDRDRLIMVSSSEGKITYSYDENDNLRSIQNASGDSTYYIYDRFGNVVEIQDPLGAKTSYEYDEGFRLKRIILPNGSVRELHYDAVGRPKENVW